MMLAAHLPFEIAWFGRLRWMWVDGCTRFLRTSDCFRPCGRGYKRDLAAARRWREYRWNEWRLAKTQYREDVRNRFFAVARTAEKVSGPQHLATLVKELNEAGDERRKRLRSGLTLSSKRSSKGERFDYCPKNGQHCSNQGEYWTDMPQHPEHDAKIDLQTRG